MENEVRDHVPDEKSCTKKRSRAVASDWKKYQGWAGQRQSWPPSEKKWTKFLRWAGQNVSTYERWKHFYRTVAKHGAEINQNKVNPRTEYKVATYALSEHFREVSSNKTAHDDETDDDDETHILFEEARLGCYHGDLETIRGHLMNVAWAIGCHTGRRPMILTAIQLKDLTITVQTAKMEGQTVLFPSVKIRFSGDNQEASTYTDFTEGDDLRETLYSSLSYWTYRWLVLRDCFEAQDPLSVMTLQQKGCELLIKEECQDFFLLCEAKANFWIDTQPCSGYQLGSFTEAYLDLMGKGNRTYIAHRSGLAIRGIMTHLLDTRGQSGVALLLLSVLLLFSNSLQAFYFRKFLADCYKTFKPQDRVRAPDTPSGLLYLLLTTSSPQYL